MRLARVVTPWGAKPGSRTACGGRLAAPLPRFDIFECGFFKTLLLARLRDNVVASYQLLLLLLRFPASQHPSYADRHVPWMPGPRIWLLLVHSDLAVTKVVLYSSYYAFNYSLWLF